MVNEGKKRSIELIMERRIDEFLECLSKILCSFGAVMTEVYLRSGLST
jgi:hypothetical protein